MIEMWKDVRLLSAMFSQFYEHSALIMFWSSLRELLPETVSVGLFSHSNRNGFYLCFCST